MNRWKGWFIVVTILLVICCALVGVASFTLNDTRNQLAITQEQLSNTEVELNNVESQLIDTEDLLATTQQQLVDTEAELSTIETQLNLTEAELNATETQLNNTETLLAVTSRQLETTVNENDQMLNEYANLRAQINVRFGNTTQDIQSFITPNNQTVQDKAQEITGGYSSDVNEYWRDCERLYRWVVNNISYSYDSYVPSLPLTMSGELNWFGECWRTPEETLEDETGDCEDMALLLASMLLSYNEGDYAIWLLTISSPDGAHIAVAFPVAYNELTILDPAGNYYTGWQHGTLSSEPIQTAVNNWLSHWSSELPGAEIVQAFSDDFDEHFDSTDEFIAWASE